MTGVNSLRDLKSFVRKIADQILFDEGLSRQGQIYYREESGILWVIQLQYTSLSFGFRVHFLFGIHVPGFIPIFAGTKEPNRPDVSDCVLQMVLLSLDWQQSDPKIGQSELDATIERLLEKISQKFKLIAQVLRSFKEIPDVIQYLEGNLKFECENPIHHWPNKPLTPVYLGVLYWLNGQQDEARRSFDWAVEQSRNILSFVETIEIVRERTLRYDIVRGTANIKER